MGGLTTLNGVSNQNLCSSFSSTAADWKIVWKFQCVIDTEDPTTMLHPYAQRWTRISCTSVKTVREDCLVSVSCCCGVD